MVHSAYGTSLPPRAPGRLGMFCNI
jgi:hypothetical protein